MRTLYLATDAFGGHGGIALYNQDLLSAISTFPTCTQIVAIPKLLTNPPGNLPPKVDYRIAGLHSKWRYVATVLRSLVQGSRFDVIVCAHINLLPLAYLCALTEGKRLVLLIYGIDAWQPNRSWLVNWLIHRVDQVVSISETTASRFAKWSGVDPKQIELLPNAVHMEWYGAGPRNRTLVDRYGLDGKTVLMTLGRLVAAERHKGFDEVLEAMPQLLQKVANLVYLIVGDGPDRGRLQDKARALGVQDHVVFAGLIPESEKADHYRLANLFVMPSRGEGFGFVLLEALACGIPVIASTLDGGREAVRDGELGDLVNPDFPHELQSAVLKGLARPMGSIPPGLDYFSFARFVERAHLLFAKLMGPK